jgi:hypothetical protein
MCGYWEKWSLISFKNGSFSVFEISWSGTRHLWDARLQGGINWSKIFIDQKRFFWSKKCNWSKKVLLIKSLIDKKIIDHKFIYQKNNCSEPCVSAVCHRSFRLVNLFDIFFIYLNSLLISFTVVFVFKWRQLLN